MNRGWEMKGYKMYTQIKHLKDKGFTRHWVAKQLGIHRKTVSRYWDMPVDEYEENLHCILKEFQYSILHY